MGSRLRVTSLFFVHLLRDLAGTLCGTPATLATAGSSRAGRPLAVGVDIFPFFERMTGVGWYEWNVLAHLPAADPDLELRFYAHTFAAPDEPSPPALPSGGAHPLPLPPPPARASCSRSAPTLAVLRAVVEPVLLLLDGNDVFFAPNFFVPRRHQAAAGARLVRHGPRPGLPAPAAHRAARDPRQPAPPPARAPCIAADALIAVSAATAATSPSWRGSARAASTSIHEGVDPAVHRPHGPRRPPTCRARYLLFVSTLEPRKNVVGMLRRLRPRRRSAATRATSCWSDAGGGAPRQPGALAAIARCVIASSTSTTSTVTSCGRCCARAEALLFPSLLEGFGLPVVEAMACGTPVITSQHARRCPRSAATPPSTSTRARPETHRRRDPAARRRPGAAADAWPRRAASAPRASAGTRRPRQPPGCCAAPPACRSDGPDAYRV